MGELLWEKPNSLGAEIMRCKGIFAAQEGDVLGCFMLQGVEEVFEMRNLNQVMEGKPKFLFIGKDIDREALQKLLQECVMC